MCWLFSFFRNKFIFFLVIYQTSYSLLFNFILMHSNTKLFLRKWNTVFSVWNKFVSPPIIQQSSRSLFVSSILMFSHCTSYPKKWKEGNGVTVPVQNSQKRNKKKWFFFLIVWNKFLHFIFCNTTNEPF